MENVSLFLRFKIFLFFLYLRKKGLAEERFSAHSKCDAARSLFEHVVNVSITLVRALFENWNMCEHEHRNGKMGHYERAFVLGYTLPSLQDKISKKTFYCMQNKYRVSKRVFASRKYYGRGPA